ncbi:hypothetical protein Tco_0770633 [Tanacetum coccineum]|uniref:Uncharacterized protein n=1 Tax=Tanacetum coccineum TaxID=301880 RepID=A0ABQ4ZFN5_9ASTR
MITTEDAMPWVGLYVAGASLACTLAMAADTFQGFQKMGNSGTEGKIAGIIFLFAMLANFLPSLGLMDDKELLVNMVAWTFTVPALRRILEHRYKELHGLASYPQVIKFSYEELEHNVKKYWMMAETGNPQFVIACSEIFSDLILLLLVRFNKLKTMATLERRINKNALKSINQLLSMSEKNEPGNLIKLLKKSTGFKGPFLHFQTTLTTMRRLIASMREGLQIVRNIEECLNAYSDLVKTRRATRRVWTQVEVYRKWLQIDLQKKARGGNTSKEILEWLRDEAVKIVIQFKSCKKRRMDDSHYKFIVASSMYRVSETILIHCSELENWPIDGQLLEWISNMIADILCACFTNLPCVIKTMCHHDAIEKREDSVRSAAQLLGRSRKILEILNTRKLPNLDVDSMAYIDKWHVLPKSEIPNGAPLNQIQLAFPSPNESVISPYPALAGLDIVVVCCFSCSKFMKASLLYLMKFLDVLHGNSEACGLIILQEPTDQHGRYQKIDYYPFTLASVVGI